MIIHVTQEDIDNGIKGSSASCPIALAVKREISKSHQVWVGANGIVIEIKTPWWKRIFSNELYDYKKISLPKKAEGFVINFDSYNDASITRPFDFEIKI